MEADTELSEAELAAIARRAALAMPGPWRAMIEDRDHVSGSDFILTGDEEDRGPALYLSYDESIKREKYVHKIEFVAAARQDVPRLVAEIERLRRLAG